MNNEKIEENIEKYIAIFKKYNETTNIYSKNAYDKLPFHIKDSQIVANIIGNDACSVVDMGSGSGLPAVIIAICNPNNKVVAIESKNRKRKFLHLAKNELRLSNLFIHEGDIQSYLSKNREKIDFFTAKAFAPLPKIEKILNVKRNTPYKLIIPYSSDQINDHDYDHEKHVEIDENGIKYHYLIREHKIARGKTH